MKIFKFILGVFVLLNMFAQMLGLLVGFPETKDEWNDRLLGTLYFNIALVIIGLAFLLILWCFKDLDKPEKQ